MKEAAQTTTRAVKAQASEFTTDVGHELNRVLEQQKARGADAIRHAELDCEPRARAGRVHRDVALGSGPSSAIPLWWCSPSPSRGVPEVIRQCAIVFSPRPGRLEQGAAPTSRGACSLSGRNSQAGAVMPRLRGGFLEGVERYFLADLPADQRQPSARRCSRRGFLRPARPVSGYHRIGVAVRLFASPSTINDHPRRWEGCCQVMRSRSFRIR